MAEKASYERVCGVDVSKGKLDACFMVGDQVRQLTVSNDEEGIARIIDECKEHQVQILVAEATGGLQRPLAVAAVEAELPVAIVNGARIRFYALCEGLMAKTDRLDARIIASFARKIAPKPMAVRSAQMERLAQWTARKGQLVKDRVREENRLQQTTDKQVLKSINAHLKFIAKQIVQINELLANEVASDPELQLKAAVADEVAGVGEASAISLVVSMPELGTLTSKAAACLAGLAPFNNDSGKAAGERHIIGGRASVRSTLYMCVLSAVRYDLKIRTFYEDLLKRGKCKMKALTACMRKMIVVINARIREALAAAASPASATTLV